MAPWTEPLIHSVATRLRTDPAADVRPSLLVLSMVAAFHAARRVWLADETADLATHFLAGADLLAEGLEGVDTLAAPRRR
jgi:hypothetical protein